MKRLLLLTVLAVSACAERPCGIKDCDIRDVDCQRRAAEIAACLRETTPVYAPVRFVSEAQYKNEAAVFEPSEKARVWAEAAWLLGLAKTKTPPQQPSPAGYFDPETNGITLIENNCALTGPYGVALLVHEFSHVLQARDGFPPYGMTTDESLGAAALVEGDATWTGDLAVLGFFGRSVDDQAWPKIFADWKSDANEQATKDDSLFVSKYRRFAYPNGTPLVQAIQQSRGWAGVREIMAKPVTSTMFDLSPDFAQVGAKHEVPSSLDVAIPDDTKRFVVVDVDRLGSWMFRRFLQVHRFSSRPGYSGPDLTDNDVSESITVWRDTRGDGVVVIWNVPDRHVYSYELHSNLRFLGSTIVAASDSDWLRSFADNNLPFTIESRPAHSPESRNKPMLRLCYTHDQFDMHP